MTIKTENFDFELPVELIAQRPPARRDSSALLHLDRSGGTWTDRHFAELPELLGSGDLLVINDTKVVPARFYCTRATGGKVEGLFLQAAGAGQWEVMLKNASRCKPGQSLTLTAERQADRLAIELVENLGQHNARLGGRRALRTEQIEKQKQNNATMICKPNAREHMNEKNRVN